MLSSVDPCEDFYEHVCGGWIHNMRVPPSKVLMDVRIEAQMLIDNEIVDKLNHTVISYANQNAIQKAAAFYLGCINMGEAYGSISFKTRRDPLESFVNKAVEVMRLHQYRQSRRSVSPYTTTATNITSSLVHTAE